MVESRQKRKGDISMYCYGWRRVNESMQRKCHQICVLSERGRRLRGKRDGERGKR